jgi:hypothetical protein
MYVYFAFRASGEESATPLSKTVSGTLLKTNVVN